MGFSYTLPVSAVKRISLPLLTALTVPLKQVE